MEKQRKIQECVEAVEGLTVAAQASENTCRNLKQEIEDFKDRNAMKKAEKDLRLIKLDVVEGQVKVMETELKKTKEKSVEMAEVEDMTLTLVNMKDKAEGFGEGTAD